MPLATKNGSLIVKDGKVAENCNCCGGWYCYCDAKALSVPCSGRSSVFCGIDLSQGPPYSRGSVTVWVDDLTCDEKRSYMILQLTENCVNSVIEYLPAYTSYSGFNADIPSTNYGFAAVPYVIYGCAIEPASSDGCRIDSVKATWARQVFVFHLRLNSDGSVRYRRGYSGGEGGPIAHILQTYAPVVVKSSDIAADAKAIRLDATQLTSSVIESPTFPYTWILGPNGSLSDYWIMLGDSTENRPDIVTPTSLDSRIDGSVLGLNVVRKIGYNSFPRYGTPIGKTGFVIPHVYTKTYRQMIDAAMSAVPAPTLTIPLAFSGCA